MNPRYYFQVPGGREVACPPDPSHEAFYFLVLESIFGVERELAELMLLGGTQLSSGTCRFWAVRGRIQ